MDIFFYTETHTKEQINQVCELTETKPVWFQHLARGHGKVSLELAIKIEAATRAVSEDEDDCITVNDIFDITGKVNQLTQAYKNKLHQEKVA